MKRAGAMGLVAIMIVGSVFGCGSGGGEDATTTLTPHQFLFRVSRACKQVEHEKYAGFEHAFKALAAGTGELNPSQADLRKLTLEVAVPTLERLPEQLATMSPPPSLKEKTERLIAAMESEIEAIKREPDRYVNGLAFTKTDKAAFALHVSQCTLG